MTKSMLEDEILRECFDHRNCYDYVFDPDIPNMFENESYDYIYDKIFESLFGDILPNIIANKIRMKLIILYKVEDRFLYHTLPLDEFSPTVTEDILSNKALILIKRGEHYDGLDYIYKSS